MTTEETKKFLNHCYSLLPFEIQQALSSPRTAEVIDLIAAESHFDEYQTEALELETIIVMYGLNHPSKFIRNIQNELRIPYDLAKEVAEKINIQIFRPIRESLKKIHGITDQQPTTNDLQQKSEVEIRNYELGNVQKTTASSTNYKLPSTISQVTPAPFPSANGAETDLSQEKILKDIETPAGGGFTTSELQSVESEGQDGGQVSEASHPASSADMLHSFTTSKDKQAGTDLLEDKLTTISKLPKAEYEHIEEAPKKSLSSKTYNADPYREAIE